MEETPEEETRRLLEPQRQLRNSLAAETLLAMLDGKHELAQALMQDFVQANFHLETMQSICDAWDAGNVTITDTTVEMTMDSSNPRDKRID